MPATTPLTITIRDTGTTYVATTRRGKLRLSASYTGSPQFAAIAVAHKAFTRLLGRAAARRDITLTPTGPTTYEAHLDPAP